MGNIEEINFREGEFELSVRVEPQADTVWLNRQQKAQLFDRDIKTIGKHIQSALREELDDSVVAKFATVRLEGTSEVERQVEYYNLGYAFPAGIGSSGCTPPPSLKLWRDKPPSGFSLIRPDRPQVS